MRRSRKLVCPVCRGKVKVVLGGNDAGVSLVKVRHKGRHPTDDDRFHAAESGRALPRPRYRHERRVTRADRARRPYRLLVRCTGTMGHGVPCPLGLAVYGTSRASAMAALRRRLAALGNKLALEAHDRASGDGWRPL